MASRHERRPDVTDSSWKERVPMVTDRKAEGRLLMKLKHRKGADMSEWPEELRIREWPKKVASP